MKNIPKEIYLNLGIPKRVFDITRDDIDFKQLNNVGWSTDKIDDQDLKFVLSDVSHSTTPNYLDDKYEVKWLINNTYQVEQNGNCVYQGSESDCNEWLKCQLGYCG